MIQALLHSARTISRAKSTWSRSRTGLLTQELVQEPGRFGLGKVPARLQPDRTTSLICGFCSTGCSLNMHLKNGQAVNLTPTVDYPVNLGMACPKGWEALTPLQSPDRATTPLFRNGRGQLQPVSWDLAMRALVGRFQAIQEKHGPDALAWIGTGQIVTEELALLGSLAKFGMGIRHGDGNTRQCMATAATAYKESFGFDAPPFTYRDFEESDVIVLVGSNLCIAHPIMWQRVLRNRHDPAIVVVDPRKTETALAARQHYAPRPKSDLTLFYGLAHLFIQNGWIDRSFIDAHTRGFDTFREHVQRFTPEKVSAETGLTIGELRWFAQTIRRGRAVSFWWTMGVNQSHEGTRTAQAIINLALLTGNIGRPGTGANSITGQCNAMGSRLFSNTTNLLGGRDFTNVTHREEVGRITGIPLERIPSRNSWAYDQILDAIDQGKIKGLWIIATNTAHSWIHQNAARALLARLEFLVVQDMYANTETAKDAHLVLPAAGWGEKDGTFINSERRIGLVKKVAVAPGQALSDFNIFKLIAHYWGCADLFQRWSSPEAVFHILKELSIGRPCDFSGILDYRMIEEQGGIQWPFPKRDVQRSAACPNPTEGGNPKPDTNERPGTGNEKSQATNQKIETEDEPSGRGRFREARLFADGRFFHMDGKARFIFESPRALAEPPDSEYPFLLLTGRGTSAQWHTQTRTGRSAVLRKLYPSSIYVEIHPEDAARLRLKTNGLAVVRSRRGELQARIFVTATVQAGHLFIPMHYEATNRLTHPSFDPYSRQPAYKACAVAVQPLARGPARDGRGDEIERPSRPAQHD